MNKEYLGDSIYVYLDEGRDMLVITTENGNKFPTNEIFFESEELFGLMDYIKRNIPNFWQIIKERL